MYLVPVVEANFGRDETSAEFIGAVLRMIDAIQQVLPKKYQEDAAKAMGKSIIGISELDEADEPPEHKLFRKTLVNAGIKFNPVNWASYEPMAVGAVLKTSLEAGLPMCKGVAHLTPNRTLTRARIRNPRQKKVAPFDAYNHHAPRKDAKLAKEISQCRIVHKREVRESMSSGHSGISIGDWNDGHYPGWPDLPEHFQTAVHDRLDYIRFWNVDGGATIEPVGHVSFRIGIDPHVGHVSLLAVS